MGSVGGAYDVYNAKMQKWVAVVWDALPSVLGFGFVFRVLQGVCAVCALLFTARSHWSPLLRLLPVAASLGLLIVVF